MFKFIGNGSAFNTALGNNGAFIKEGNRLLMIDCGSATFERIQKAKLLDDVNLIEIVVTHFHPDHIGSLGDLIFYSFFMKNTLIDIYTPDFMLSSILHLTGVKHHMYNFHVISETVETRSNLFDLTFKPIKVAHDKGLNCYGYIFETDNLDTICYYSGDCNEIPSEVVKALELGEIDIFYQDTSKAHYDGNVHLSLQNLTELIQPQYRNKVWCMHLDGSFDRSEAEALGFNVTNNILEEKVVLVMPLLYSGYKEGQKVVVRSDLIEGESYGSRNTDNKYRDSVVDSMMEFAGQTVTIKKIVYEEKGFYYRIDEDKGNWNWMDMMFE